MPRFVTIQYGDREGYDRTPRHIRNAAHACDAELVSRGMMVGTAGEPFQVRNPDNEGLETKKGSFLTSDLPVAGFAIIEAKSLDDAIQLVSKQPCAVAHGVIEVWPLELLGQD